MSIDKDPEVYKLLIGGVAFLIGILNAIGIKMLSDSKENDKELFERMNKSENRLTAIETRCKEKHNPDNEHERRKKQKC